MMSSTQQRNSLQKYLDEHYMPFVFNDLHTTNEQMNSKEWFKDKFFFKVVNDGEHNFYKRWYEVEGFDIRADTILILLQEVQDWFKINLRFEWTPENDEAWSIKNIVNAWAYNRGVEHWRKNNSNVEDDGINDFPPNETEDTCPICLMDYNRNTLLKDGIQNSDCISSCPHWCCVECWNIMYHQYNEIDTCPICRADITDWLKSHYPIGEDSDDDEEDEEDDEEGDI